MTHQLVDNKTEGRFIPPFLFIYSWQPRPPQIPGAELLPFVVLPLPLRGVRRKRSRVPCPYGYVIFVPLVAYNINLNTPSLEIAHDIAKKIRFIGGGLRYCKAMGVELKDRGITQVSINMTDYTRTALYRAFELVRIEARRYGVSIVGSEIIGLVPMEALIDTASYYLGLENFSMQQVLEARIME